MPSRKKPLKKTSKPLDEVYGKRARGRPRSMPATEVCNRADNYRGIFESIWNGLRQPLLKATTEDEVTGAFEKHAGPYAREFVPLLSSVILTVIRHPKFPKRPKVQIGFLADSLAGLKTLAPRRARDVVAEELSKQRARQKHKIVRKEFYIECSCGYEGPTYKGKCPMRDSARARIETERILLGPRYL